MAKITFIEKNGDSCLKKRPIVKIINMIKSYKYSNGIVNLQKKVLAHIYFYSKFH